MSQAQRGVSSQAEPSVPALVYPYTVGVIGGALGGLAMIVIALCYGVLTNRLWLPINLIGATLVRELQTAPIESLLEFNAAALVVGLALHGAISVGLGFVFALLLPTMPGHPLIWSVTVGPLLWAIASLITLPAVNPAMANNVDVPSFFIAHLAYGLVMGWWIARSPKIRVS